MQTVFHADNFDDAEDAIKDELAREFSGCRNVALKMHFGEPGNATSLGPEDVLPIVKILKDVGCGFFLFDSAVMYGGIRSDPVTYQKYAADKGFAGAYVSEEYVQSKGKYLDYEVCRSLADADAVLVVTHFKGHACSGFGGAIKNLGMGALTKHSKTAIHKGGEPIFEGECIKCGRCVKNCPIHGMKLVPGKKYPEISMCYGCSNCAIVCPQKVIRPRLEYFDTLLADGANSAQKKMKKIYFITIMKNITRLCDCCSDAGEIIHRDEGLLFSKDAVAIDKAAFDILTKDENIFLKYNLKTGLEQIHAAEKLGMGNSSYELKKA